uniref:Uncharacterized protein n=1 Tax=viral metagenome TaxID=1070528 RepID=A0A6M3KT08_9ZZZZ
MTGSLGGRIAKSKAAKKQREFVRHAIVTLVLGSFNKVSIKPIFFHKVNRRRDEDNAVGSLKSAYDGIVDSGLIKDDSPEYMIRENPEFRIDKQIPRVELRITILE